MANDSGGTALMEAVPMGSASDGAITAARVVVRPVTATDLPALFVVNSDDDVTRYLPYASWQTPADAVAWLTRIEAQQDAGLTRQFVVVDRGSGAVVGSCLLHRIEQSSGRAELGYVLGRASWGKGLMREAVAALVHAAFTAMGFRRLEAEVDPRNAASLRLLQALGFTREGLLRQRWVSKGEARDVHMFGLLSHEWPSAQING